MNVKGSSKQYSNCMIFVDFDDTIFNTKNFKREYFSVFKKAGISKELFDRTYYFKNGIDDGKIYHYEKHLEKLEKVTGKDLSETKKELVKFLENTSRFVFRDFWKFATLLKDQNKILLSFGCLPFQGIKIESCGVTGEFDKVITTCGKKSRKIAKTLKTKKNGDKIFFLDDRPEQLEDVRENIPNIFCIRIRRKSGRYFGLAMKKKYRVVEAPDLLAAANLIKRLS